ncbi:MAG: tripartite tricarboxylate transporter TctB family protein [Casimicrobiaceae bacterium]
MLPYLLVLAGASVLTWNSLHFGFTAPGDRPGPDMWPRAILALMIVTCLVRIGTVLRSRRDGGARARSGSGEDQRVVEEPEAATRRYPLLLVAGIGLTIAYVALLTTLGFFLDSVIYIGTLIRIGRYRRWPIIAAVAVGGAFVLMLIFMKVVYLSLPIGRPPFSAISLAMMTIMHIR